MAGKYITLLIVPDDEASPRRLRLPRWVYRGALFVAAFVLVAPIVYFALFYDVMARAAAAERLASENQTLKANQVKMKQLEQSLIETRQLVAGITSMAGLDSTITGSLYEFPPPQEMRSHTDSPVAFNRTLPVTSPFPEGLPVSGWVSRGYSAASGKRHDGIDIAIPEGTAVLATGAGVVKTAGHDDIYGEMIVVQNNDSIETIFGHNSRLLVKPGDSVIAGIQVALSGNTGKSSAPHLHYEIRVHGKPINPMMYSKYETNTQ